MNTTYFPRASIADPSIVFDSIATESIRYLGCRGAYREHLFQVEVAQVIAERVVAREAIPAVMDDTTFFMTEGRAEEAISDYVEWKTGCWENNGRKLAELIAVTERAPLRIWSMPS